MSEVSPVGCWEGGERGGESGMAPNRSCLSRASDTSVAKPGRRPND